MCSCPYFFIISVPEATQLPITFFPVKSSNSPIISSGKPSGYTGKALSNIIPANSQCPVVVSFPSETSAILPNAPIGFAALLIFLTSIILPNPMLSKFSSWKPFIFL